MLRRRQGPRKYGVIVLALSVVVAGLLLSVCLLRRPDRHEAGDHLRKAELSDRVSYDVIVFGTEPSGVSAAVSSAREGLHTLLVSEEPKLGGTMTMAWLNSLDMNYDRRGNLVTRGIFERFYKLVGGDSFDVGRVEQVLKEFCVEQQEDLDVVLGVRLVGCEVARDSTGASLESIVFEKDDQTILAAARYFIDGSGDGDMAALAGAEYTIGRSDAGMPGATMASTLVFRLDGVDWSEVQRTLQSDDDRYTGATATSAWGFYPQASNYVPSNSRLGLRGLNLGRQADGSVLVNALWVFGVDGTDRASRAEGRQIAVAELPSIVRHLVSSIPEFSGATLGGAAPELYIRESRHFKGIYTLQVSDIIEHRDFMDKIAVGSYPVDVQPYAKGYYGMIVVNPDAYSIPARSLLPNGYENLAVVDRCASYSSTAAGSSRVLPVGMVVGEAAGILVAEALRSAADLPQIVGSHEHMIRVQQRIKEVGGYLGPLPDPDPVTREWSYPYLKVAMNRGAVSGGYENDFALSAKMPARRFSNLLNNLLRSVDGGRIQQEWVAVDAGDRPTIAQRDALGLIISALQEYRRLTPGASGVPDPGGSAEQQLKQLVQLGVISTGLASRIELDSDLLGDLGIALAVSAFTYIENGRG